MAARSSKAHNLIMRLLQILPQPDEGVLLIRQLPRRLDRPAWRFSMGPAGQRPQSQHSVWGLESYLGTLPPDDVEVCSIMAQLSLKLRSPVQIFVVV